MVTKKLLGSSVATKELYTVIAKLKIKIKKIIHKKKQKKKQKTPKNPQNILLICKDILQCK